MVKYENIKEIAYGIYAAAAFPFVAIKGLVDFNTANKGYKEYSCNEPIKKSDERLDDKLI